MHGRLAAPPDMRLELVDVRQATQRHYEALAEIENLAHAERLPDDPPVPLDEAISDWRSIPDFIA